MHTIFCNLHSFDIAFVSTYSFIYIQQLTTAYCIPVKNHLTLSLQGKVMGHVFQAPCPVIYFLLYTKKKKLKACLRPSCVVTGTAQSSLLYTHMITDHWFPSFVTTIVLFHIQVSNLLIAYTWVFTWKNALTLNFRCTFRSRKRRAIVMPSLGSFDVLFLLSSLI